MEQGENRPTKPPRAFLATPLILANERSNGRAQAANSSQDRSRSAARKGVRHGPIYLTSPMSERILAFLVQFVTHVIQLGGYAGIAALMGIESACIPLPSEIIMPFAGYLVYLGHFNLFWVATAGAVGCNLGSLHRLLDRRQRRPSAGRALRQMGPDEPSRPRPHDLLFSEVRVHHRPAGRLLPVVRTFIAFPAGIAKMPQLRFHIYTFVGSWPWCFGLGLRRHEAGRTMAHRPTLRAGIPSLPSRRRNRARGSDRLVCLVAS